MLGIDVWFMRPPQAASGGISQDKLRPVAVAMPGYESDRQNGGVLDIGQDNA